MDVSVVVTAYNQNSLLEVTLGSILQQDFDGSFELIVCDDGSNPDALSVIHKLPSTNKNVRYIYQQRDGSLRARNRNNGIRLATGRILIFVDGDIAVCPHFVSQHVRMHTRDRLLVYGARSWVFAGDFKPGVSLSSVVLPLLGGQTDLSADPKELIFQKRCANSQEPWLGCFSCNMSVLSSQDVRFDENFVGWGGEDSELACRLYTRHGYSLVFEPSICGIHLTETQRADFVPLGPRTHDEIAAYIRNIIYFRRLYPELEMKSLLSALGFFEFDISTGIWKLATPPCFGDNYIRSITLAAENWYVKNKFSSREVGNHI